MILSPLTPLFVFIIISIIQVAALIFVLVALAGLNSPYLYSTSYWALITTLWSVPVAFKYLNLRFQSAETLYNRYSYPKLDVYERLKSPSLCMGILCSLCSLISFPSYLASPAYERPAALFAFTAFASAASFLYLHLSAHQHGQLYKHNRIFYVSVLIIQFIFGTAFVLLHITSTWQAVGLANDNVGLHPIGEMVSLGYKKGYSLHLRCMGAKRNVTDPLVWFEHGWGGQGMDFIHIQNAVSQWAKTCSYDHAGLGHSHIPIVDDTLDLLKEKNITDDLLIVGHSMAGYNVRVLQRLLLSNRISGIVLIDPVDTNWNWTTCKEGDTRNDEDPLFRMTKDLTTFGITRILAETDSFPEITEIRKLPNPREYLAPLFFPHNHITRSSEYRQFPNSCGYTKRIVETYYTPTLANVSLTGTTSHRFQLSENPAKEEGFGNLPYGLVLVEDGLNSVNMSRLSSDSVVVSLPNVSHTQVLFDPGYTSTIVKTIQLVFDKCS